MIKKQGGFILILTLGILSILSLLVLSLLKATAIHFQALNSTNHATQTRYQMERLANDLMKNLAQSCIQSEIGPNQLPKKQGCQMQYEGTNYYYWIEDLGLFPCIQIQEGEQRVSSHHYRLTLKGLSSMQLRFVKAEVQGLCQQPDPVVVKEGGISWRLFLTS